MLELLTVKQAAALLKVTRETTLRWIKQGKLRASKPGRAWRIPLDEVERMIREAMPQETRHEDYDCA